MSETEEESVLGVLSARETAFSNVKWYGVIYGLGHCTAEKSEAHPLSHIPVHLGHNTASIKRP